MPAADGVRLVREGQGIYRIYLDGAKVGTVVDLYLGDGWSARYAGPGPWGWVAPTRRDAVAGLVAHVRNTAPDPED